MIDPKPLAGEREFAARADRPLVRARPLRSATSLYRLDRLTSELGLDRERARGWTIAPDDRLVATAATARDPRRVVRWLLEARELRAVLFDVDFTLARPGPELGPEGYVRAGGALRPDARCRPATRRLATRRSSISSGIRSSITTRRSGSHSPSGSFAAWAARAGEAYDVRRRDHRRLGALHENFELYEDALPVLDELRRPA